MILITFEFQELGTTEKLWHFTRTGRRTQSKRISAVQATRSKLRQQNGRH